VSRRCEVWLVGLDPTVGSEMKKTRPGIILSPDEMNARLHTVIVAPLTSRGFAAPFRVPCRFENKDGQIALDQLRAVDKTRLMRKLGQVDDATANAVLAVLAEMFSA
jgi:mRNA interferase MazF